MIACRTIIGFGMPGREGTQKAHSDAPGAEVVAGTRKELDWPYPPFVVPDDICEPVARDRRHGRQGITTPGPRARAVSKQAKEFDDAIDDVIPPSLAPGLVALKQQISARRSPRPAPARCRKRRWMSSMANCQITIGGSADLTPSNNTKTKNITDISAGDFSGRYIHYGIREHGMAAAMNGMALHGGVIPYGGTFLVFCGLLPPLHPAGRADGHPRGLRDDA